MPTTMDATGKAPRRTRRTRAQIEEDLLASGIPSSNRATPSAVKRSRLAAQKRARAASEVASAKQTRDSPAFQLVDYQTIVAYLGRPNICNALFGGGSQTRVSGLPMNPQTILNSLAIKLNNNYNIRNNSTDMRLNGRVLHQRLKRFKSKYSKTKAFSLKTGSGLSAKNVADGIHNMHDLLESMCPCFEDMDILFRDKGNINPFGILETGISEGVSSANEDENEELTNNLDIHGVESDGGSTTDGHDHSLMANRSNPKIMATQPISKQTILAGRPRFSSPDAEELEAYQELFESQVPPSQDGPVQPSNDVPTPEQLLNSHYRRFLDNDIHSPPPTPKLPMATTEAPELVSNMIIKHSRAPPCKTSKRKASKKDTLTAEERALDSSSEDDDTLPKVRAANRSTLARRPVDPLPSIDPSTVRGKELKHPVATAMQQGNAAKIEMLRAANEWRQEFDAAKQNAEVEARKSDLSWAKEKFFLEREEERNRLAIVARKERKAFCEKLVLEGKSPQELEAYLRLVYPDEGQ